MKKDRKIKLMYEDVMYKMAVPAQKIDIILWVLTGGRKGRLFICKSKKFRKWMSPPVNINCRCSTIKIDGEKQ